MNSALILFVDLKTLTKTERGASSNYTYPDLSTNRIQFSCSDVL